MPIVWLSDAIQDVTHPLIYISEEDPASAKAIAQCIDQAISRLSTMPSMGRPGRIYETRELAIAETTYLVVYRVRNQRVEILRVLHGHQSFPDMSNL